MCYQQTVLPMHLDSIQDIGGFSGGNYLGGEEASMLIRGFYDSDQSDFHKYMKSIVATLLPQPIFVEVINSLLILIHTDGTGDVYLNNVPIVIEAKVRRAVNAGEPITQGDISDISRLRIENITIAEVDKIILCFRKGWKFGLLFDFTRSIDLATLETELGFYYKRIAYKEMFKVLGDDTKIANMASDGWFPFIELIPDEFILINGFYSEEEPRRSQLINNYLEKFDGNRMQKITSKWWAKDTFNDKKEILEAGISAFLAGDPAGHITSIKTIYSEIEGILKIAYLQETARDGNLNDLKKFLLDKARNSFSSSDSLGFPHEFYEYLGNVFLKNFNLQNGEVSLSRRSSAHGVASGREYTKAKALQGLMILDQIFYSKRLQQTWRFERISV
jgi:hypothetical protein